MWLLHGYWWPLGEKALKANGPENVFLSLNFFFLVVVGLNCCVKAFSSCSEQELLSCRAQASCGGGFSCYRAQASGTWASGAVACRLSSYDSRALEYKLSGCGAWAEVLRDMWNLPRPGSKPMCLGGQILTHCTTREVLSPSAFHATGGPIRSREEHSFASAISLL